MKHIIVQFITDRKFVIVFQTHKGTGFLNINEEDLFDDDSFFVNNGFSLASRSCPEPFRRGLYVQGSKETRNNDILNIYSPKWKEEMLEAIKAYNVKYG
jgi:hypothetical protein